jgi:ribosomal protein S18 acetylase RimI-like enzyme
MFTVLGGDTGYVFYIAVSSATRSRGVGGLLLEDALRALERADVRYCLGCVRAGNAASIALLRSHGFVPTRFRELASLDGFWKTARTWISMVVAPGERVWIRRLDPGS